MDMRVLIINCVCGIRSTGRICTELADEFIHNGDDVRIAYGRMDEVPERYRELAVRIGDRKDLALHTLKTRLFDQHGLGSTEATRRFLSWAEEYRPELIWLHNIHGYYINAQMLFDWIKRHPDLQVRWTLHDCWAFTGHCAYFTAIKCEQWKTGCVHCPQLKEYPACYGPGNVRHNYEWKRNAFTGVPHMTLVTPSQWLADLVGQSYLKEYPIEIHYNTVNTDVFKPTQSDFRDRYGLQDKRIVLGVASTWDTRKGLRDLCQLACMLNDQYAVVVVGLTEGQTRKLPQMIRDAKLPERLGCNGMENFPDGMVTEVNAVGDMAIMPDVYALYCAITGEDFQGNSLSCEAEPAAQKCVRQTIDREVSQQMSNGSCQVIGLPKTNSAEELAGIYTAADVFVNPTYEDNYPTVNLEARACGTRVITYDTGGCRETLL